MRLLALGLLALVLAGCFGPALPPRTGVHAERFTSDGGAWRAYHLALCGLCGPDSPSTLFVVFADGKLVDARIALKTGEPVRLAEGLAYDADELSAILDDRGGNVTALATAAVDDTDIVADFQGRWHPQQREDLRCADFAAEYGWWPEGGAPERIMLTCPATDDAPMQPFVAQIEKLESGVDALDAS